MNYYKHKKLNIYIMVSPTKIIKTYRNSVIQYTKKDCVFKIESDVNTDIFKTVSEHEFNHAFVRAVEKLIQTLKTLTNE